MSYNNYKGDKYNASLSTKDISKLIREYIKKECKGMKFSVTCDRNSITVALMAAPFEAFKSADTFTDDHKKTAEYWNAQQHAQINHYYLDSNEIITVEVKEVLKKVYAFMLDYNRDDSDIQTDYFNTNFYTNLHIGKWNKPFVNTSKN